MAPDLEHEELRRIAEAARALGPIDPPPHLKPTIRRRVEDDAARPSAAPPTRQWMGLAAALVLVTVSAYQVAGRLPRVPQGTAPAPSIDVAEANALESLDALVQLLGASVGTVLTDLRALTGPEAASGPEMSDRLAADLSLIDRAIAESRSALGADPQSGPARASLVEALRHKADMLNSTLTLIGDLTESDAESAADGSERHP